MPIVPYKLDPGFNQPPLFRSPVEEPERPQGGFLQFGKNWGIIQSDVSKELEIWEAAIGLENAPANLVELMTKPSFAPQEDFDLEANLKAADMWDDYRWNFVGVESSGEFLYKTRKILKEKKARELIAASGSRGIVALMAAGVADPTILLPFVGAGAKIGRGIAVGAGWGLAAGSLQEIPLQLNQELRTMEESGINVALSTVLGGVLGGAVGTLNGIRLQHVADGMDPTKSTRAISPSEERVLIERTVKELEAKRAQGADGVRLDVDSEIEVYRARLRELEPQEVAVRNATEVDDVLRESLGRKTAAGADVLDLDAGALKGMLGIGERLRVVGGAVTSVLGQRVSSVGRRMMAQYSTAGLRLERNLILDKDGEIIGSIPSNEGGTIEGLIQSRRGEALGLIQEAYENFADHRMTKAGLFRNTRAAAGAMVDRGSSKLSRRQFFDEVGKAMRRNQEHEVPEVAKTAASFRKYYDDLLEEAQDQGLIPREIREVTPDLSYLNRVFDHESIARNPNEFRKRLANHFERALRQDLEKIQGGYESATAKDAQRLADAEMPLDQAIALRDKFRKELEALDKVENEPELRPMEELISDLRAQLAANTRERRQLENALASGDQKVARRRPLEGQIAELRAARETTQQEIERLQQLGGAALAERALQRGELKRRIRNLNRSRFMVEEKHRAKLDKIENLEEANVEALRRAARAGVRAQAALDKDDVAFVKAMADLTSSMTAAKNAAMKLEGQIEALQSKQSPTVPSVKAGMIRFYHGTKFDDVSGFEGKTFLTPQEDYARNYRSSGPNDTNNVFYVDMTKEEAIAADLYDEINNYPIIGSITDAATRLKSFDAPADEAAFARLFEKDVKQQEVIDRFVELEEELAAFKNINLVERGRDDVIGLIQDALDHSLRRIEAVNAKRTKRIAKLEVDAKKLDGPAWEAHKADIQTRMKERKVKVRERVAALGGEGYDPDFGAKADFSQKAKEISETATDRIMGVNMRLAGFDAMTDARGAELARILSIPSEEIEDFLVNDAEHLLHVYANTLIPDIEIVRRMGPFAPDGSLNVKFKELNEEQALVELKTEATLRREHTKNGVLNEAAFAKERDKVLPGIRHEYDIIRQNLDVVTRRLRHQWGIPSNPDGWLTRGVQAVLSVNALRFLGTVGVASIPDVSKPVFRYGLGRTFRTAWLPMINNWKAMKLSAKEAQKAFVGVEVDTADRAFQLADLMEYARGKTKAERGLQWATSKMGIIALYAPWTDIMKVGSFRAMTDKVMESLELAQLGSGSSKERKEALEFLASLGWNDDLQRRIWDQMQNGGAEKIKGLWVPQTEKWTDRDAIRSFRAAAYSESAASIITPGIERPKIADANLPAKLFFNLKSFALASTSKTLMAGMQQRDVAVLNGVLISLALGALSYYLRAVSTGGETERRMRDATWEQWVDEAVDASGLLGAISIGQRMAQDLPYARNVASLGAASAALRGEAAPKTSRASGAGAVESAFGPQADLAFTVAQVMTGLDNPTRAQIHKVRQLLPLQNLVYIRRLFDQAENAAGDAINAQGQRR